MREILEDAGFGAVESTPHETTVRAPASAVADRSSVAADGRAARARGRGGCACSSATSGASPSGPTLRVPLAFRCLRGGQRSSLMAGYSGTPLPKKLGITEGSTLALVAAPPGDFVPLPTGVTVKRQARGSADVVVAFFTERRELERRIGALGDMIFPDGGLWVAWPKRALRRGHDGDRRRRTRRCVPLGLVDNKVCAIDDTWSGLRVVWRRERREPVPADGAGRTRAIRRSPSPRQRPDPEVDLADDGRFAHGTPVAAVAGFGPIVTHHEDVSGGDPVGMVQRVGRP